MKKHILPILLTLFICLALLPAPASAADMTYRVNVSTTNPDIRIYTELEILNRYRTDNGLEPLTLDVDLTEAAMQRAAEIAIYYDGNHVRPNGKAWHTVDGLHGALTAENIAYGYVDASSVMKAWEDSPSHNQNILNPDFTSVGIGFFCPTPGQFFWTQSFSSDDAIEELIIDYDEAANNSTVETYSVEILESNMSLGFLMENMELHAGESSVGSATIANKGVSNLYIRLPIDSVEALNPDIATAVLEDGGDATVTGIAAGTARFKFTVGTDFYFTVPLTILPPAAEVKFSDSFNVDTSNEVYAGRPFYKTVESPLTYHTDYDIFYKDNTNAGTATVIIEGRGTYEGESLEYHFTIEKAERELNPRISNKLSVRSDPHSTVWPGDNDDNSGKTRRTYRFTSSNTNVVTVDDQGELLAIAPGYSTITIEAYETDNYKAGRATLEVMVTEWSFEEEPSTLTPPPDGSEGNTSSSAALSFTDVEPGAYYADAVNWAVTMGITNGTSETKFSPNNTCTRAQIITFLWRAAGSPEPHGSSPFNDVSADAYYAKATAWAAEKGMAGGRTFSPNAPCTREMAVEFMWRQAGSPVASVPAAFTDVSSPAVDWALEQGVTTGTSETTFSPDKTCTRGQIVTFLYRAFA